MTNRRKFVATCAWMLGATPIRAQRTLRSVKIGVIRWDRPSLAEQGEDYRLALAARGYVENANTTFYWRSADENPARADEIIAEFVRESVDVILAGPTPAAHAARRGTRTIPIVITGVADPLGSGLVTNLARPEGNLTGLSGNLPALAGKRVEILAEALAAIRRISFLGSKTDPATKLFVSNTEQAARQLGLRLHVELVAGSSEFESAFARIVAAGAQGLVVQPIFWRQTEHTTRLALKHKLPAISDFVSFARDGGLLSYGPNRQANAAMIADYVDRILKGAKPGELPIQEPTRFTLGVNTKTAAALGIVLPRSIIDRADEVFR